MTSGEKKRIFLVDDDPCILDTASLMLESVKYVCTCFSSADKCLEHFDPRSCDLVITDVQMPRTTGLELLAHIKKTPPGYP